MKMKFDYTIDVWYGVIEHYKERYDEEWESKIREHVHDMLLDVFGGKGLNKNKPRRKNVKKIT